jgi:DNA-binding transcriptional regulator YiaG
LLRPLCQTFVQIFNSQFSIQTRAFQLTSPCPASLKERRGNQSTLTQFTKELTSEKPKLAEIIETKLNELRLSERLKAARKSAGLTQLAVAERMHVNLAYVAQLESRPQNITIATLLKYNRAVGAQLKVEV